MHGSFTLLGLLGVICVLVFDYSIGAMIASSSAFLGFLIVFIVVFFRWESSEPDYITKHGTAVWTDGLPIIDRERMEQALDFYIRKLPSYASQVEISTEQLEYMLKGAQIEWSRKKISAIGIGWQVKDKAGLQSGKAIKVYWSGSIVNSALYHELHHMVDEIVIGLPPDYKHERTGWWSIIPALKKDFGSQT